MTISNLLIATEELIEYDEEGYTCCPVCKGIGDFFYFDNGRSDYHTELYYWCCECDNEVVLVRDSEKYLSKYEAISEFPDIVEIISKSGPDIKFACYECAFIVCASQDKYYYPTDYNDDLWVVPKDQDIVTPFPVNRYTLTLDGEYIDELRHDGVALYTICKDTYGKTFKVTLSGC